MFIKYKIKYVKNMINILFTLLYTKIKHSSFIDKIFQLKTELLCFNLSIMFDLTKPYNLTNRLCINMDSVIEIL